MAVSRVPMHKQLTRDNLHGVWAAVATPFDAQGRFDADTLRENVRRLHAAGAHGVYTTDSDGEFYAIELEEFKQIIDVFADEAVRLGIPTQVGVTWSHTQGILDRLRHAAARGILGAHVGHPTFMPMTPDSYSTFWEDVRRAVPEEFALIHYNTPRCPNYLRGPDYAALQESIPTLVGTKHVGSDFPELLTLMTHAPMLSHFCGEHAMTPYMLFGARGVYSWMVNFNPRFMLEWYECVAQGQWEEARRCQERLFAFGRLKDKYLRGSGNYHGIINKAMTAASDFLVENNVTRRPYLPVPPDAVAAFRRAVEAEMPDLVWRP